MESNRLFKLYLLMQFLIETERLILREFRTSDDKAMFELDSDLQVHQYLGNNPVTTIEQVQTYIANIQQQYLDNGIGRWITIEKSSDEIIGWAGLKFITEYENNHINFHDVGYRLMPRYWGKGYATEATNAILKYGFETMNLKKIIGTVNAENKASRNVLEKCGLQFVEQFYWKNILCDWLEIIK
jgi:ribosomal-protein-alanine N-acetyltransferase